MCGSFVQPNDSSLMFTTIRYKMFLIPSRLVVRIKVTGVKDETRCLHRAKWMDSGYKKLIPGLVSTYKKPWKDPPCYSWVNQLFRLGHFQVRKLWVHQRVWLMMKYTEKCYYIWTIWIKNQVFVAHLTKCQLFASYSKKNMLFFGYTINEAIQDWQYKLALDNVQKTGWLPQVTYKYVVCHIEVTLPEGILTLNIR